MPKKEIKHSFEWVEWHHYNDGFVCGIYHRKDVNQFTSVLSDLEDKTFTSIEAARAWIDNRMKENK